MEKFSGENDSGLNRRGVSLGGFLLLLGLVAFMAFSWIMWGGKSVSQIFSEIPSCQDTCKERMAIVVRAEINGMVLEEAVKALKWDTGLDFSSERISSDAAKIKMDFFSKGQTVSSIIGSISARLSTTGATYSACMTCNGDDINFIKRE